MSIRRIGLFRRNVKVQPQYNENSFPVKSVWVYTVEQLRAHLVAENSNSINESLASIIAGRRR